MIKIVLILFIITLIIIIYRKKREGFKNIKNQDYIISMFLTNGLCKEAENLIITLKRLNLQDKLIVTCLDKNADKCIKKLGVKTRLKELKLANEASFGTKDFYDIMYEKLNMIHELLIETNKVVLYTDTDIVFLKDPVNDINKFINSDYHMLFQDESSKFIKNTDYGCAGFMIFKPVVECIDLLKYSKKLMKDNWDNREWDNGGGADQKAINIAKKEIKDLNYSFFDSYAYPNGARYFNNINTVYKDYTPVIIHNNFIKGLNNKIKRFKKHGFWYVKDKIKKFENKTYYSDPKLFGTKYGGFYLPRNISSNKNIVYYGVGVGEDISFDINISKLFNCDIHLVDPTDRPKKHVEKVKYFMNNNKVVYDKREGGGDKNYWNILGKNKINSNKLKFHYFGIGTKNSIEKFYSNKNENYVSGSFNKNMNFVSNNYKNVEIKTLDTLMNKLNHKHIHILKLDIEGLEIEVLNYIFDKSILPEIICVDFDSVREGKYVKEYEKLRTKIDKHYNLYYDDNYDITFIKRNQNIFNL